MQGSKALLQKILKITKKMSRRLIKNTNNVLLCSTPKLSTKKKLVIELIFRDWIFCA